MKISIDDKLMSVCRQIMANDLTLDEWTEVESSDMFQSKRLCGGFDAEEGAFLFSYFTSGNQEY